MAARGAESPRSTVADRGRIRDSGGRRAAGRGTLGGVRIADSRSGQVVEVGAAGRGMLRIGVYPAGGGGPERLGDLRALLVADVLFRAAEATGAQVLAGCAGAVSGEVTLLGVHPPGSLADLGRSPDVDVVAAGAEGPEREGGALLAVGPVAASGPVLDGAEPAAVRLALLGVGHGEPVRLTGELLDAARARLGRWRDRVARWADSPSRPAHAPSLHRIREALDDGLDTAAVLAVLDGLEGDPDVPDGSKFETFLLADRVLALELPSRIGRP